jgi:hypothetical protein
MNSAVRLKDLIAPHFWETIKSKKPTPDKTKVAVVVQKRSKNALKIVWHCLTEEKCGVVYIKKISKPLRKSV